MTLRSGATLRRFGPNGAMATVRGGGRPLPAAILGGRMNTVRDGVLRSRGARPEAPGGPGAVRVQNICPEPARSAWDARDTMNVRCLPTSELRRPPMGASQGVDPPPSSCSALLLRALEGERTAERRLV